MSQKTTEKTPAAEKTEKTNKTAKTGSKNGVVSSRDTNSAREKTIWTLERCQKYARSYSSEILWASGSPASYKSAVAHGWLTECLAAMTTAQKAGAVVTPDLTKKAA
jgi:hypothetical protein